MENATERLKRAIAEKRPEYATRHELTRLIAQTLSLPTTIYSDRCRTPSLEYDQNRVSEIGLTHSSPPNHMGLLQKCAKKYEEASCARKYQKLRGYFDIYSNRFSTQVNFFLHIFEKPYFKKNFVFSVLSIQNY